MTIELQRPNGPLQACIRTRRGPVVARYEDGFIMGPNGERVPDSPFVARGFYQTVFIAVVVPMDGPIEWKPYSTPVGYA